MTDTHIINLKNVMRSWNLWIKKGPKETVKAFLDCAKDLYQKKATDNQIQAPAFIEAITDAYKTLDVEKQIELSTSLGFKWIWPINTQKDFDRNKANILSEPAETEILNIAKACYKTTSPIPSHTLNIWAFHTSAKARLKKQSQTVAFNAMSIAAFLESPKKMKKRLQALST